MIYQIFGGVAATTTELQSFKAEFFKALAHPIRMRMGCARALKNSALKDCSSVVVADTPTKISYIIILLYSQSWVAAIAEQRAVHRGGARHGRVEREPRGDRRLARTRHRARPRRIAEDLE